MEYPKYPVNIGYVKPYPSGQTLTNSGGVTFSVNTYSGGYYVANMVVVDISATGSTYESALANLLTIATASSTVKPGQPYYFQ